MPGRASDKLRDPHRGSKRDGKQAGAGLNSAFNTEETSVVSAVPDGRPF